MGIDSFMSIKIKRAKFITILFAEFKFARVILMKSFKEWKMVRAIFTLLEYFMLTFFIRVKKKISVLKLELNIPFQLHMCMFFSLFFLL